MNRRKELKDMYKTMKTDMGIFVIKSNLKDMSYLEGTEDLKSTINSTKFKLGMGMHPNIELQKDWKEYGESNFTIEILEKLKYDEDETKVDYNEELDILKIIWQERLSKKGMGFY